MKKIFLFIAVILTIFNIQSQIAEITYLAQITPKAPHSEKTTKSVLEMTKQVPNLKFYLLFDEFNSHYYCKEEVNVDLENKFSVGLAKVMTGYYNTPWFQDNNLNSSYIKNIKSKSYEVDYSKNMKNWEVTKEKKDILGFVCYKAIRKEFNQRTGKDIIYTAWFTKDLSSPFGPIGNGGLEGVILELNKGTYLKIYATNVNLMPIGLKKVPKIISAKKVSVEESIYLARKARGEFN